MPRCLGQHRRSWRQACLVPAGLEVLHRQTLTPSTIERCIQHDVHKRHRYQKDNDAEHWPGDTPCFVHGSSSSLWLRGEMISTIKYSTEVLYKLLSQDGFPECRVGRDVKSQEHDGNYSQKPDNANYPPDDSLYLIHSRPLSRMTGVGQALQDTVLGLDCIIGHLHPQPCNNEVRIVCDNSLIW